MVYKKRIIAHRNKKPKKPKKSEIDRLIRTEKEIEKHYALIMLKKLNKKAYIHMMQPNRTYKQKYRSMQKEPFWNEAKQHIIRFKRDLRCPLCKSNATNDFVLHHKKYELAEFFTPTFVQLVHNLCHVRHHRK